MLNGLLTDLAAPQGVRGNEVVIPKPDTRNGSLYGDHRNSRTAIAMITIRN
jgi:hypothetical protein